MLDTFKTMAAMMEERWNQRPRGFDLFNRAMISSMVRAFDDDVKTVFVSGYAFPYELLWAFDVAPFDLEIATNNLPQALNGQGSTFMTPAENQGYSQDICSFHRLIIGCLSEGMLPTADLTITSSYYCQGKAKTWEIVANRQGGECVAFDVPNEVSPASIRYVTEQLKDIAGRLAGITGQRLDMDRLKNAIHWSNRARKSLQELNDLMKLKPCPWDGKRASLLGLGGAILLGSPIRDEIHNMLISEITARVEQGKTFPEDYRVLWYPWAPVQQTNIFDTFKENQVSVVMSEPAYVWWSEMDETDPFEALALKALENPQVGTPAKRISNLEAMVEEYDVDGVVHFSTPACYHETTTYPLTSEALKDKGIPVLDIPGDMTDERKYFPEQTRTRVSAFIEVLHG
jgi:benzoyl-CoA reductase/2-hydroxyglutaryl-CoA dehydratase subunit BcrC/BadD/HgdB